MGAGVVLLSAIGAIWRNAEAAARAAVRSVPEGRYFASSFLDDDGITHVLKVGPTFEVIATNKLGEEAYSSPAISQGQFLIRGDKHLFCIGK